MATKTFIDKLTGNTITIEDVTMTYTTVKVTETPPTVTPSTSSTTTLAPTTSTSTTLTTTVPVTTSTTTTAPSGPSSYTIAPFSIAEHPGSGVEQWHDRMEVSGLTATDVYARCTATTIEKSKGNYDWSFFHNYIKPCIDKGQKFSFGLMTVYLDGPDSPGVISYAGGYAAYPQYVHDQMQAESPKDWLKTGCWIPNWNSIAYANWLTSFHKAIYNFLATTYYNGVKYLDVINEIDIRGYGNWGEWHSYLIVDNVAGGGYPSGTGPTFAGLKRIVDSHVAGFPDIQLQAMISGFDANRLQNTFNPPEIRDYLLTASNQKGLFGWRRDNWGASDDYIKQYLSDPRALDRYKYAPVTGEPCCSSSYSELPAQAKLYHANSFGNGNFGTINATNVKAAYSAMGYKLAITGGTIQKSARALITISWASTGLVPIYEDWKLVYEYRNATGVVFSVQSTWSPRLLLGGSTSVDTIDFPSGTYDLYVRLTSKGRKDLLNYKLATIK